MRSHRPRSLFLCSTLLGCSISMAQSPLQTWPGGSPPLDGYRDCASAGDLDGDSFTDVLIVRDPLLALAAYSGRTGALLFAVATPPGVPISDVTDLGDIDGDSVPDFAAGYESDSAGGSATGNVRVYSGANGSLIYSVPALPNMQSFGLVVRRLSDINGDGFDEWMGYSANPSSLAGQMSVHSGADGALIHQVMTPGTLFDGFAIVGLPDQNSDGTPDFAFPRAIQGGILEVFSGVSGQLLAVVQSGPIGSSDLIDDMDGDGQPDLLIGAPGVNNSAGRVRVLSTSTWNILVDIAGEVPSGRIGQKVSGLIDLSGDGVPDILSSGYGTEGVGIVRLYSGQDGSLLRAFDGDTPGIPIGGGLDSLGDANGDGFGDYLIVNGTQPMRVELYLGGEDLGFTICTATIPNSVGGFAGLEAVGSGVATDNQVTLQVTDLPVGQPGMFLNALQIDSVVPSGSLGTLCLGGAIGRYNQPVQTSGANGSAFLNLDLTTTPRPTGPVQILAGETWYFQFWYRDVLVGSGTSNFSSAKQIVFQ